MLPACPVLYPALCQGWTYQVNPPKMGETPALVGCLAQNLHAGTRQYLLGGLLEVFGMQPRGIWDALGFGLQLALLLRAKLVVFFLLTKYDSFFFCVRETHLQTVCSPWLEGAVSASQNSCGGYRGSPCKLMVVLTCVRRMAGQFSWLAIYYFRFWDITKPL